MYSYKENYDYSAPSNFKMPYSRPHDRRPDPTVSKILKRPRTSEINYGRSIIPEKQFGWRNPHSNPNLQMLQNYDEPSTSYAEELAHGCDDVFNVTINNCYSKSVRSQPDYEPIHFRPRRSQIENRTHENSFDHSLELKMMTIGDTVEMSENLKKSKVRTGPETPTKGFQVKARQNLLRIFTGSVENLLHWSKLKTDLHMLFEVTATVESVQPGTWKSERKFYLTDSRSGPKLQVVYHEIDRPLPKLVMNSLVTCVGRLVTRNRLQAYKVEECSEEKKNDLKRLSFICNRVADELVVASQKK